ncbi:hypothetical protein [Actinophytocola sp.]|jgi:hypothetical protein|uniref:hypothetical protein n=1 Tax=Actinophytocola sp. TaxID=1872138 RepID=UPI002ED800D3
MTDKMQPPEVERTLSEKHRDFVASLTNELDLDARLSEIFLVAEDHRLVGDVRSHLSLEEGLRALVDVDDPTSGKDDTENTVVEITVSTLRELAESMRDIAPVHRLEFRTHTDVENDYQRRACGCLETRVVAHQYIERAVRSLIREISRPGPRSNRLASAREVADELRHAVEVEASARRSFSKAVEHYRSLARSISEALASDEQLSVAFRQAYSLAEDLDILHASINDFIDCNLENIDLDGFRLDGIRWSRSTRWPKSVIDFVKQHSEPIGDGIYMIRSL